MFLDLAILHVSTGGGGRGRDRRYSLIITNRVTMIPFMPIQVLVFLDSAFFHDSLSQIASVNYTERGGEGRD
jgi:hypothetical protein